MRRMHIERETNLAVSSLNSLFMGYDPGVVQQVPLSQLDSLHQGQQYALRHILRRVRGAGGPPLKACRAGALAALRIASSPYLGDAVGVGDVVPMNLGALSVPVMGTKGVEVESILHGQAGEYLRDPQSWMLQDASNWSWLSDEAGKIKTYDDPKLRNKWFYRNFLEKLHHAGVLDFMQGAVGRVGCFTVSKKPKEIDGIMQERQRLILDCRQVNLMFRAPPVTELGSLTAVSDLFIPEGESMFVSGGDIKDCFYACQLPEKLRPYFCLSWDIQVREVIDILGECYDGRFDHLSGDTTISPCMSVFPMGFSWSFYLVQSLHVQGCLDGLGQAANSIVLDSRPPPSLSTSAAVFMPYCDNTHSISLDPEVSEHGRRVLEEKLQSWGFEMHEQMSATSYFPTLGGIIDGETGVVKPTAERYWNLKYSFEFAINNPVSSDFMRRLLGHAMVVLVLNRSGMAIFRAAYDFAGGDYISRRLWDSAKLECSMFLGVLPLLVGDMRQPWSGKVTCTDASPEGYGICERDLEENMVDEIGKWQERWRFKRTPIEEWKPRERALGLDPLRDFNTARGDPNAFEWSDTYVRNEVFEEVPLEIMDPFDWKVTLNGKWRHVQEHITMKEARCLCLAVRRLSRASHHRGRKHLILVDSLALALAIGKGRSCNHGMLRVSRKIGALCLAAGLTLRVRWIPSEANVSDAPSRGATVAGYILEGEICQDWRKALGKLGGEEPDCERQCQVEGDPAEEESEGGISGHARSADSGEPEDRDRQGCREVGSEGPYDFPGEKQCELRAARAVPALPGEFQGLLQGEQVEISSKEGPGRNPRRLLRRFVPRGPKRCRGREDSCGGGVPFPLFERYSEQEPKSPQGVEEVEASKIEVASAEASGLRDCDEAHVHAGERDSLGRSSEFRLLPETGGDHGPCGEESHSPGAGSRKAIPTLHLGGQGRRRPCPRQDRGVQQLPAFGQSRDSGMAGACPPENCEKEKAPRSTVQRDLRGVSKEVPRSWALAWVGRVAHLPTSTWRRVRRLGKKLQGSPWGQIKRQMAHRLFSEEVRKVWKGPGDDEPPTRVGPEFLPEEHDQDGGSGEGYTASLKRLTWRTSQGPFFLEVFSGCGRLHRAMEKRGMEAYGLDLSTDPSDDVLDPEVEQLVTSLLLNGSVCMLWLGMPCTTFSVARRYDGLGPGPLRSDRCFPYGAAMAQRT